VHAGERRQDVAAVRRQGELDLAPVGARAFARHEALLNQSVDEADRAVVLEVELPRAAVCKTAGRSVSRAPPC